MAKVRAPVAGASGVDQRHECEDAEDDDQDDEPARHVARCFSRISTRTAFGLPEIAETAAFRRVRFRHVVVELPCTSWRFYAIAAAGRSSRTSNTSM